MQLPKDFVTNPKKTATGGLYTGRFVCPDVQWTGEGENAFCTFTVTAGQIADAALSDLLWTDQAVQRGIKPGSLGRPSRELSLRSGYPDNRYVFDAENADEIVGKLLTNQKLFLSPLIWNLRPGAFQAYWDPTSESIHIYAGKIYLPDSHHRHQAIVKAVDIKREAPDQYPHFDEEKQFKIELYFLSRDDEGNYFFDKNQRPKPTALSKAFDLSTIDDLSVLAKLVIEKSDILRNNVNRVTDRLNKSDSSVVTLSTLREVMRGIALSDTVEETEMEGIATAAAEFFDMVGEVRPELGVLSVSDRVWIREHRIADSAVMFHGYGALAKDYMTDIVRLGSTSARETWKSRLQRLSPKVTYTFDDWDGDLFDKRNPMWQYVGVTKANPSSGTLTVMNTGSARSAAQRTLRSITKSAHEIVDARRIVEA